MEQLISQGAESKVYAVTYLERPAICKERLRKRYRLEVLDKKINKQRLLQEARCISRCLRNAVAVPIIYLVDIVNLRLYMELIEGLTLKQFLWSLAADDNVVDPALITIIATQLGKLLGQMHDGQIIHGDLTSSNIMLRSPSNDLVLIDFGLGQMKPTIEDKAVDLYVLERAFISTHPNSEVMVNEILTAYRFGSKTGTTVLLKLDQVRQRGRKRDMIG